MVLGSGVRLIAIGYVIGAATAYALSRAATGRIPGIVATDPLTLGIVGAIVAIVGLAACLLPAIQAARVDPVVALRTA
jgi:ABC-type antimicrobial peptide transport system permease subunit